MTRESRVTIAGQRPPGATVVVYLDGTEVGRMPVDADGRFSCPFTAPQEGTYLLTAVALVV